MRPWNSESVHLVTGEGPARVVLVHVFHQALDLSFALIPRSELGKPFAKKDIERRFPAAGLFPGLLDHTFIRAESDVFYDTKIVHTKLVRKGIFLFTCWKETGVRVNCSSIHTDSGIVDLN